MKREQMDQNNSSNKTVTVCNSIDAAYQLGYLEPISVEGSVFALNLLVKPNSDLAQSYFAFDCDENELIQVNGWLFDTCLD